MSDAPSADDHDAYRAWCDQHGFPFVPGFVQRMPPWSPKLVVLPCCTFIYQGDAVPEKGGRCPACKDQYWIRECPDGVRRVLNRTAMVEVACLDMERHLTESMVVMTASNDVVTAAQQLHDLRRIARDRVYAKFARG